MIYFYWQWLRAKSFIRPVKKNLAIFLGFLVVVCQFLALSLENNLCTAQSVSQGISNHSIVINSIANHRHNKKIETTNGSDVSGIVPRVSESRSPENKFSERNKSSSLASNNDELSKYIKADKIPIINNWLQIFGKLRSYNFNRDFTKPGVTSQNSTSIGGELSALTMPILGGIQAGIGLFTAQPVFKPIPIHVDNILPGWSVNALGEAFVQYQNNVLIVRVGNQIIDTPWFSSADATMIPAAYQGFYAKITPLKFLSLSMLRSVRYKGRADHSFTRTNLYNVSDASFPIKKFGNTPDNGALAGGINYTSDNFFTQAWQYKFYDLANLSYGDIKYTVNSSKSAVKPFVGIQVFREWGDGNNILSPFTGGIANALGYGVTTGVGVDKLLLSFGYNDIAKHAHAYYNGDILSPYTIGYMCDPLYTTMMMRGLVEKSAGQAYKILGTYHMFNDKLAVILAYARYRTEPGASNTQETDLDIAYAFDKSLQGLSIRNRFGRLSGNPAQRVCLNNRIQLQYLF